MPAIERLGVAPNSGMDALFRLNIPVPLAGTPATTALGLMISPAVLPVAVILALMLTLFEAMSVRMELEIHEIGAFTFRLPACAPPGVPLVWSTTLVPAFKTVLMSVFRTTLPPAP